MDDNKHNNFIISISKKIIEDNTSLDEQDVSILENYQKEDGTIAIPDVLQKYTGFNYIC